jgi:hypothetical protein
MKFSEKVPHSGRPHAGETLQDMTFTAQVFGNYVLMPARRRPDGSTRPVALHGSALLVFPDEVTKKVQLRTGYPARVAGHAALHAAEDRSDEIVSRHDVRSSLKQFLIFTFWYFLVGAIALAVYCASR